VSNNTGEYQTESMHRMWSLIHLHI